MVAEDMWPSTEGAEDLLQPGHGACPGCAAMPAFRWALRVLGPRIVVVSPSCCFYVNMGDNGSNAVGVPFLHSDTEATAAYASGIRAALDAKGDADVHVLAWDGDSGTLDGGFQALSAAAHRNENLIFFCYDHESSATGMVPRKAVEGPGRSGGCTDAYLGVHRDLGAIMAAHRIPYFATASLSHPADMIRKIETARDMKGFRMIHYFSPCPPQWQADARHTIRLARLGVESGLFPLYECFNGERLVVNHKPLWMPLAEYVKLQGRYVNMSADAVENMERLIRADWVHLELRANRTSTQPSA